MIARMICLSILICVFAIPSTVHAQGTAAIAREMAEYVMKKFGKEVADEGVETLTRKIETIIVKYGDDAAEAMIKHGEIAQPLIGKFGDSAALALKTVSSQNARRISMLEDAGELATIGRTPELLTVVAKYGDAAMDFVWNNKGTLTVAAVLTAFLSDPEPFINGTRDLAQTVGTSLVQPIAQEVGKRTNWTIVILALIGVVSGFFGLRHWLRSSPSVSKSTGTSNTGEQSDAPKSRSARF